MLEEKDDQLKIKTCEGSVNLANNIKKVHDYLESYSRHLKTFAAGEISPHAYLPSYQSEDDFE